MTALHPRSSPRSSPRAPLSPVPDGLVGLDDPRASDPVVVGAKSASLASLRAAGEPVPQGMVVLPDVDAVLAAEAVLHRIGDVPLAVRSSCVAEDLADASFAGHYLTVLDVRGRPALADAIDRVRVSAGTAPRVHDGPPAAMPVLVMPLVFADAAGVAFSVHPVTGAAEVCVDAVPGLADALVSGAVSPQRWVVAGGQARQQTPDVHAITEAQARAVARIAERVAQHRGSPQDIEWAIAGGEVHLLQARPITALPVAPVLDVPPGQTWIREDEHFGRPLRPLEFDVITTPTDAACRIVFAEFGLPMDTLSFRLIGGWPFVRSVPLMDPGKDSPKTPPAWLFGLVLRIVPPLRRRLRRGAEVVASSVARDLVEQWTSQNESALRRRTRELRAIDRAALDDEGLARHLEDVREHVLEATVHHNRVGSAMFLQWGKLAVLCERLLGWTSAQTDDLLQGHSAATREGGRALEALAAAIDADPEARRRLDTPRALLTHEGPGGDALRRYLERHGHTLVGFDFAHPTHAEDPTPLLAMVRRQWQRPPAKRDPRQEAERAAEAARARLADLPDALRAFERALDEARRARPVGDDSEMVMIEAVTVVRYIAVEAGRRLGERGRLPDPEAILFLTPAEILTALRGGSIDVDLDRRRGEFRWARANPAPERYGPPPAAFPSIRFAPRWARPFLEVMVRVVEAVTPTPREEAPSDGLRGVGASPGRVRGHVRILREPSEFDRVQPGNVLVCPMTWAAWSVVFPLAAAVVTERGGPLSHPAILAREFGIPAVLSVPGVTHRLVDGQEVIVDGTDGLVTQVAEE